MADYSSYEPCGCSSYGPHRVGCEYHSDYQAHKHGLDNNMTPIYSRDSGMLSSRFSHYICKNGCGCLVWNIRDHMRFAHGHLPIKGTNEQKEV